MTPASQSDTPYLDALRAYAAREPGRFHVPGHKGGPGADPALRDALGPAALALDIPALTYGIDVGADPTPFEEAQPLAAEAWGARRAWFLVNGASQGNHVALLTLAHRGREVIVQRNAHSSTIDALVLSGLRPTFVAPELDPALAHRALHDARRARARARRDARRGRRDGGVTHLLRRGGGHRRAGRGGARPRRAADRGRGLGGASRLPPRAAAARALARRRPRGVEHPQDRGQPHPGRDDPPRARRPARGGGRGPLRDPDRVHEPQLAPRRARSTPRAAAPRCAATSCWTRRCAASPPRGWRCASCRGSTCSTSAWPARPACSTTTRSAWPSTFAAPATAATRSRGSCASETT